MGTFAQGKHYQGDEAGAVFCYLFHRSILSSCYNLPSCLPLSVLQSLSEPMMHLPLNLNQFFMLSTISDWTPYSAPTSLPLSFNKPVASTLYDPTPGLPIDLLMLLGLHIYISTELAELFIAGSTDADLLHCPISYCPEMESCLGRNNLSTLRKVYGLAGPAFMLTHCIAHIGL